MTARYRRSPYIVCYWDGGQFVFENYARHLRVAPDDPGVLSNSAAALAFFGEDIGAMIALVDRALTINPSFHPTQAIDARRRLSELQRGGGPVS